MKKKIFLLLGLLSTTVFAQNNFLLFANNGLALNGIHSSEFAQDFAIKNRVNSNNQLNYHELKHVDSCFTGNSPRLLRNNFL